MAKSAGTREESGIQFRGVDKLECGLARARDRRRERGIDPESQRLERQIPRGTLSGFSNLAAEGHTVVDLRYLSLFRFYT